MRNKNRPNLSRRFREWFFGDAPLFPEDTPVMHSKQAPDDEMYVPRYNRPVQAAAAYRSAPVSRLFARFYNVFSVLFCLLLIGVMVLTISYLPRYGDPEAARNNEVAERYLEKGLEETGAVNLVAGMILDYRAFDTFGESCVLFTAVCCVLILLKYSTDASDAAQKQAAAEMDDRLYEPKNDLILCTVARVLVPCIFLFGIYIVLNGHLSAGGGFSGGAVLGAGLILFLLAFGFKQTSRIMNERIFRTVTVSALLFYCLSKGVVFFCGANGIALHIPLGTPGALLSAGLILPLNICVGMIVACTMYAFYAIFRKGSF